MLYRLMQNKTYTRPNIKCIIFVNIKGTKMK